MKTEWTKGDLCILNGFVKFDLIISEKFMLSFQGPGHVILEKALFYENRKKWVLIENDYEILTYEGET